MQIENEENQQAIEAPPTLAQLMESFNFQKGVLDWYSQLQERFEAKKQNYTNLGYDAGKDINSITELFNCDTINEPNQHTGNGHHH